MEPQAYIGATVITYHEGMPVPTLVSQVHGLDSLSGTAFPLHSAPFPVFSVAKADPGQGWGWHWPVRA